jgi:spore germination cell wall hydrolase CwlJ-like protein
MIKETLLTIQLLFSSPAEWNCLAKNIYFEARNQSTAGQIAVSHVVMNRVASKRYPNTICEVVHQGQTSRWWRETKGKTVMLKNRCQFSWYCDGLSDEPKERTTWRNALVVAKDAYTLWGLGTDISEGSMWYHAQNVKPRWRSDFDYVARIDDHLFYRTKNWKKNEKKLTSPK